MKITHLKNINLSNIWTNATSMLKTSFSAIDEHCLPLGFFGLINLTSLYIFDGNYPAELIKLTWIGLILSTLLMLTDYAPKRFYQMKRIFWLSCVFFILPFFAIAELVFTYASAQSLLNTILSLFLLVAITDWLIATLLILIATASTYLYTVFDHWQHINWDLYYRGFSLIERHYYMTFYFIWALIAATVFLRKIDKKKENYLLKRQLKVTQIIASSIAHELRTPLLTIKATIEGLRRFTPILIESYDLAKENNLAVKAIPDDFYQALKQSIDRANNEVTITNTIINILLIRLRGNYNDKNKIELFDISKPILAAIERYPYDTSHQKNLIHLNLDNTFTCRAIFLLVVHIFFNLIKNALYQIRKIKKGEVYIWFEQQSKCNIAYFKDTGPGINKKHLAFLFDEFFSMTSNGTGVGLTFCKLVMREIGGNIRVQSIEGIHTTFILTFPKLENEEQHD